MRCLPMIAAGQFSWLLRVLAHKRGASYARGAAGALLLARATVRERAKMRPYWKKSRRELWRRIMQSELLARNDFKTTGAKPCSLFLKWYFRLF
jgi:hypothetical protein